MVKRCAYGICNSDTRYPGRLEGGVVFFPFPKPKTQPEKCRQWIKQCGRPHSQLNPTKISPCTYICSKHFVNGKPTAEYPNPLAAAVKVSNPKRKLGRNQKRLRCEEDECSDASSSSSLEKTPEDNQGSTVATDTGQCVESRLQVKMNSPEPEDISIKQEPEDHPHSTLRSSPPVKLSKHRVDGSDGSGASASSYGELRSDLAMRYKPIAPAPARSNHTPPEPSSLQVKMSSPEPAATVSHQLFLIAVLVNRNDQPVESSQQVKTSSPATAKTVSIQQESDHLDPNYNLPVEKRTDCDKCGKIFQTSGALQIHLRTHTGEKPYQCDECGIMIRNSNSLKVHLRIHTGEKPYHCGQCGKHFKSSSGLKSHMKSHSGKKPYQCHQCEKSFSTRGNLRTHLRIHSGEKPFLCNLCGERFSSSTTLKSHQRGHAGKNRYHCGVCVKSFNTSSELKTHTVIHMGEKPYHCESKVQPTRSCQKAP